MFLRLSTKAVNYGSLVTLVLTGLANVSLIILIAVRLFKPPTCHEHSFGKQLAHDAKIINGQTVFPIDSTAYLSHVVLAMHESGAELKNLAKSFSYWKRYPPCTYDGYPTNWAQAHVTLTVLFDSPPSAKFAETLTSMYYELPRAVRSCFAGVEIRHAGVEPVAASNSTRIDEEFVRKIAGAERDMFSALFTNSIELEDPSHVMLLTSDSVPIQANWLNLLDYGSRIPVERFWMKGSIYRGPAEKATGASESPSNLVTLSKVALYNIGDPAFGKFYSQVARPFVESLTSSPASSHLDRRRFLLPVEHDFTTYFFQFPHYAWTRMMVPLFRPTALIQDFSGVDVDVAKVQNDSPDTVFVKGSVPDLPSIAHQSQHK